MTGTDAGMDSEREKYEAEVRKTLARFPERAKEFVTG